MPGFLAWLGITLLTTAASVLLRPKTKSSFQVPDVELPKVEPGAPIPVVFGTQKLSPHIVDLTYVNKTPVYARQYVAGITVSKVRVGTNYYLSYVGVLCWGQLDQLVDVIFDGRHKLSDKRRQPQVTFTGLTPTVSTQAPFTIDGLGWIDEQYQNLLPWGVGGAFDQFDGVINVELNLPYLYGGEQQGGGVVGSFRLYEGTGVNVPSPTYETFTGMDQPHYNRLIYLYAHNVWHGEHPQPKSIEWVVRAFPEGLEGAQFLASWQGPDGGANPVSVLAVLLTSPDFGLGIPFALLDYQHPGTFTAVYNALTADGARPFGISFTIRDRDQTVEQVINEICRTANLVLYQDVESGLIKLREIYDEGTTAELFDEDDYHEIVWDRRLTGELPNQIKVVYTDASLTYQRNVVIAESGAAIERAGRVISETLEFPMVTTAERAAQVAIRELRARSVHLRRCRVTFRRVAGDLTPGARFRVPWPPETSGADATEFVTLRVLDVDWGTIADGHVRVEAIEDVYSLPAPSGVTVTLPPTPPGTDPELGDYAGPLVTQVVSQNETTGTLGLQILDPFGVVTLVEFRTQSGTATPSAWAEDAAVPYQTTVPLSPTAPSVIAWRVTYTDAGGASQQLEGGYTFPLRVTLPDEDPVIEGVQADFGSGDEDVQADFGSGTEMVHATFT